jgi:hypothetical protein
MCIPELLVCHFWEIKKEIPMTEIRKWYITDVMITIPPRGHRLNEALSVRAERV